MVSFDLSFNSVLIEDIVEDKRALCTDGGSSWISIGNRVQVVFGDFSSCLDVSPRAAF